MTSFIAKRHALIIGVGSDLPNTITDAQGLADLLTNPERCAYPPDQVALFTEAQADRDGILAGLDTLAQQTTTDSTVIVYFSGHGHQVKSTLGDLYFLFPHGYNASQLAKTCIRGDEFAARLAAIPAQKLLLLLDCCHAGGVGESKDPGYTVTKSPLPPETLALFAQGQGKILIASSTADELSYAGKPYSAFTLALMEALCGVGASKHDGYVRVADLALHARQMVPQRTHGKQHPILHFEYADNFVVSYYAGGDSQPKSLPFPVEEIAIEPEPGAWTISGTFTGPVAAGSGDAIDLRGAVGAVVKPTGAVKQYNTHIRSARGLAIGDNAQVHIHGAGEGPSVELDEDEEDDDV